MRVIRYWRDADGTVGAEEAVWLPAADGVKVSIDPRLMGIEADAGDTASDTFALVSVAGHAVHPADLLAAGISRLYDLELPEGRTVISPAEYETAHAAEERRIAQRRAEIAAVIESDAASKAAARRAALEKMAKSAKLTPAEIDAVLGGI